MQGHKHFWPRLSRPVSRSQCLLSSIMKRSAACPIAELSSDLLNTVLERIVFGTRWWPRRIPAGDGRLGMRVGRHGTRDAPQLPGPPRARSSDRDQRWAGTQGEPEPALRHRCGRCRRIRARVRSGGSADAALRPPRRFAVRLHHRTDSRHHAPDCPPSTSARLNSRLHSARELMGAADVRMYADALGAFLTPRS